MTDAAILLFIGLGTVSFALGFVSIWMAVRFRVRVRRSAGRPWPAFAPPVAVLVACKGLDPGLEENLTALLRQEYPAYRVVFVLDDLGDPAHAAIRSASARSSTPVAVVAAEPRPNCTGKAAALIRAARELAAADEIVAFMDSDARPPPHWLRSLVAPLQDPRIGATTAYRWYTHDSFASAVRAAWNAAGTNLFFDERMNFAWGGSTALRRETFDRTHIAAKWGSALSDDMVVTQAVKGEGLRVEYVPLATVLTQEPADWRGVMEWTTRQTVMMRAYDPRVIRYAALAYATVVGSVDLGVALALLAVLVHPGFWLPAALLLAHVPVGAANAALRLSTFRSVTGRRLGPSGRYVLGSLIVPSLALANLARARKVRFLSWRGTLYEIRGPPLRIVRR